MKEVIGVLHESYFLKRVSNASKNRMNVETDKQTGSLTGKVEVLRFIHFFAVVLEKCFQYVDRAYGMR